MATTYSMDEEKKKDDELVFGQRDFDAPRREVTMKDFESEKPKTRESRFIKLKKALLLGVVLPVHKELKTKKETKKEHKRLLEKDERLKRNE